MSEELKRSARRHREPGSPDREKFKKSRDGSIDKGELFERKNNDLFPALSMVMNMMKLDINPSKRESEKEFGSLKEGNRADSDKTLLRDKLQSKLGELLEEQQALVDLYAKAARAAKEKEEEYRERIAELLEQTERDKQLMDLFRSI